jgi:hypothetical protein
MCAIGGAARPPTERAAVEGSSWARSEEWDCGDGAGGTRNAPTAGAHYVGAARTRGHATRRRNVRIINSVTKYC